MIEKENALEIPTLQKMERQVTLKGEHREEHKAALERAVSLNVPRASSYGTFEPDRLDWEDKEEGGSIASDSGEFEGGGSRGRTNCN